MSDEKKPRANTDPMELWRRWHDANFKLWSDLLRGEKEDFVDPYGFYRQWFENVTSAQQKAEEAPAGTASPYEVWRWWTETMTGAWRRAAEVGAFMTGLTPRWLEMAGDLWKQMLDGDNPPRDPMDFYLRLYNATSGPFSEIATDILENELFLEDSRRLVTYYAAFYNAFRRASEEYFSILQLPTSSDVYRVAELVVALDDKVDRIEETFEDFEYGYKELATTEAVDALNQRLDQVEKRLDQLDRVESKLDQLLAAQNAAANGASQVSTGNSQVETSATDEARRVAEELGVDLAEVQGTGSGGQITVEDVRKKGEG
jgi:pyruvate/2-oxoglutarate dehydrogenase complex dihydrolipoamide acyltransferase (E2) component